MSGTKTNINVPQERKSAWLSYFCLTDSMALHLGEILQIFLLGKLFKWVLISSIQKWGCQVTRLTVRMVCIPLFPSPKCISSLSYSSDQIPSKKPVKGGEVYFAQVLWAIMAENTWQRVISSRHWEFGAWILTSQEIRKQRVSLTTGVRKLVVQHLPPPYATPDTLKVL